MDTTDHALVIGFVIGVVKAVRAKWPSVDGAPVVTIVAALVGILASALITVLTTGHIDAQAVVRGIVLGTAAVGGIATIDRIKAPTPVPEVTSVL